MKLLMTAGEVAAGRAAWLKARQGDEESGPRIGASDIGVIMRLKGARSSPYKLWMQKTGQWPDDEELPDYVEFGNYCENFAAYLTARDQPGWHLMPGGLYADDEVPWRTATFDRMMHPVEGPHPHTGPGGVLPPCIPAAPVQLKNCAFADWAETGVPLAYRAQVLWEAVIMRAEAGYLVAFDRNAVKIQVIEIAVDDRARVSLDLMTEAAGKFRDLVARRVPPQVDGHEATTEALKKQYADIDPDATAMLPRRLAERWFAARAAEKQAKDRRRRYQNELLARAGTAGRWCVRDGGALVPVASRSAAPRAGFWTGPNPRVDTIRPSRTWTPGKED